MKQEKESINESTQSGNDLFGLELSNATLMDSENYKVSSRGIETASDGTKCHQFTLTLTTPGEEKNYTGRVEEDVVYLNYNGRKIFVERELAERIKTELAKLQKTDKVVE